MWGSVSLTLHLTLAVLTQHQAQSMGDWTFFMLSDIEHKEVRTLPLPVSVLT